MNVRFSIFIVTAFIVLVIANAQCFSSASGALCCPEVFDCSNTRCIIDFGCDRGATTCTSNVCRRPGSTPAPTPPPPPAPAPPPAPSPSPQPETVPNSGTPIVQDLGAPTPYDSLLTCNNPRTRREIRDMSENEWNTYANAVNELKNRPSRANPNINQFEDLARIHTEFVVEAHGGSFFLPWHRMFLLLFENLLREINPSIAVPYWDWASDAQDPAISSVWNRLGGSVRDSENRPTCIPFGSFENMQTSHTTPHCVSRGFISGLSGSFITLDNWLTIQALIDSDISYARFGAALESTHGSPHVGIGGDMAVLGTAPNDPVFFSHHAFVDRIYGEWEDNGTGPRTRFGGNNPGVGEVNTESVMQAFQKRIRQSQEVNCVSYEPYSGSFAVNSGAMNLSVVSLPDEFVEKNHLNKTRVNEGHATMEEVVETAFRNASP